jgi:hypothetical protein
MPPMPMRVATKLPEPPGGTRLEPGKMASIKNSRRERFAVLLAEGNTAIAAYAAAGYRPDRGAAARMSAKVSKRVEEILALAAARAGVTIESIGAQLDEAYDLAKQRGQPNAMVSSALGKARVYGLLNEHGSVTTNVMVNNIAIRAIVRVIIDPAAKPQLIDHK